MMQSVEDICSNYKVILASSSPRRYEIMHDNMGFRDLETIKPSFEEDLDKNLYKNDPIKYVIDTSRCKAESIVSEFDLERDKQKKLIVCADTVVIDWDNLIYEKPGTKDKQLANLKRFCFESDEPMRVVTAVTIISSDASDVKMTQFHEVSNVYFDSTIPEQVVVDYVNSEDGLQVAGGFKVQGFSGILIDRIDGDYFNIVGLPLNKTFKRLLQLASM